MLPAHGTPQANGSGGGLLGFVATVARAVGVAVGCVWLGGCLTLIGLALIGFLLVAL